MKRVALRLALLVLLAGRSERAAAAAMVSNLDAAGDDIQPIFATNGFAVGFITGAGSYNLDSVKLPEYGYAGPVSYFHVELHSPGPLGSVPAPGWPLVRLLN
jgi:hypothetical protein